MAHPNIEEVVRAIAEDTQASLDTVSKGYSDVLAQFERRRADSRLHSIVCRETGSRTTKRRFCVGARYGQTRF
jgi:hypothetical protein